MWQIDKTYSFTPSGDATPLILKVVRSVSLREAIDWYEKTYKRPFELDEGRTAFKAILVKGGRDGDTRHFRGDLYYVFGSDYDPSRMYGHHVTEVQGDSEIDKAKIRYNTLGGFMS